MLSIIQLSLKRNISNGLTPTSIDTWDTLTWRKS